MRSTIRRSTLLWVPLVAVLLLPAQPLLAGQYGHHGHFGHHGFGGYYGYPSYYGYDNRTSQQDALRQLAMAGLGGLDLNVKPKKTEVYVNGRFVGLSHDFDGVPGHLWLKEGTYEVIFFKPGQQTIVREFEIHRGAVIDVKERLQPGRSVSPGELTGQAQ